MFSEVAPKMLLEARQADTLLLEVPVTHHHSPLGFGRGFEGWRAAAKAASGCARPAAIARRTRRMTIPCGRR